MMAKILVGVFIALTIALSHSIDSVAGEIAFRCRVKAEYQLTDDGYLVKPEKYYYKNASFSIERATGRIVGAAFSNKGDYQTKVVDNGSFNVFSFAEKRGVAESLAIQTWQDGKRKSFIGIDYLQTIVTGTCD